MSNEFGSTRNRLHYPLLILVAVALLAIVLAIYLVKGLGAAVLAAGIAVIAFIVFNRIWSLFLNRIFRN